MLRVANFTDLISGVLMGWKYKRPRRIANENFSSLEQVIGSDGRTSQPPTDLHAAKGEKVGNPYVLTCFVCRVYLSEDGDPIILSGARSVICRCARRAVLAKMVDERCQVTKRTHHHQRPSL